MGKSWRITSTTLVSGSSHHTGQLVCGWWRTRWQPGAGQDVDRPATLGVKTLLFEEKHEFTGLTLD